MEFESNFLDAVLSSSFYIFPLFFELKKKKSSNLPAELNLLYFVDYFPSEYSFLLSEFFILSSH